MDLKVLRVLPDKSKLIPVAMFVALALVGSVVWQWVEREQVRNIHSDTAIAADQVAIRLETFFAMRAALVEHIADEWSTREVHDQATFYDEALRVHRQFPGFLAINRVDSQGVIRWVTPDTETQGVAGINIRKLAIPGPVFEKAERTGKPQTTPPIDLVHGGKGIVLHFPLKRADHFDGTVAAVFRISDLIEEALRAGLKKHYFYAVTDGEIPVYNFGQVPERHPYLASRQLRILDRGWTVSLMPTPARIASEGTRAGQIILIIGLLLSAGLAWLLRLYLLRQQALRKSEERYALAVAGTNDGIWERNLLTDEVHRSPRMLQILGYEPGELGPSREAFVEIIHPEDAEKSKSAFRAHLETGVSYNVEYRIRRKSGEYIWVNAKAQATWDEDGKPVRMAGSINDITDRKRTEEALRESERRYRGLIENSGLGIHIAKPEGGRLFVNDALISLLGYDSPEEIYAVPEPCLVAPHDQGMSARRRMAAGENSGSSLSFECDFVRKDGSIIPLHVIMRKIVWDGEDAVQRTVIDLSERRKAEDQIRASLAEKEVLLREIHHRVKNNLQVISSLLSLQADADPSRLSAGALKESQRRIKVMAGIHESLHRSADLSSINARDYMENLVGDTLASSGKYAQRISSRLDVDDIIFDVDSAVACGQVISELLSNSLKHAFPNGQSGNIEVSLHRRGGQRIELAVADDGMGLPEDFDLGQAKTLGMRLVHALAMQLDGEIRFDGSSGTRIQITFPEKPS